MSDVIVARPGKVGDSLARNGEAVDEGRPLPDAKPLEYRLFEADS